MIQEFFFLNASFSARLVVTLAHFVWQGLAIAVVAGLFAGVLPVSAARRRHSVYFAALLAMLACPLATFAWIDPAAPAPDVRAAPSAAAQRSEIDGSPHAAIRLPRENTTAAENAPAANREFASETQAVTPPLAAQFAWRLWRVAPFVAALYGLGVCVLLVRLAVGYGGGWRLRRRAAPVDDQQILAAIGRAARSLRMQSLPAVLQCADVAAPIVVGLLRPVVVLPLSFAAGLTCDQVQAILTHELAHLRRCDHLVNLLQRLAEALLFFHPAVWWISRRLQVERENACDDLVVAHGADPRSYAASLLAVAGRAARRRAPYGTALAATNSRSQLGARIRRLVVGEPTPQVQLTGAGVAGLISTSALVIVAVLALASRSPASRRDAETDKPDRPATAAAGQGGVAANPSAADRSGADPSAVVTEWIELVREDKISQMWPLTTKSVDVDGHDELPQLWKRDELRAIRAMADDSTAMVVTNTVRDNSGRDRGMAFRLVRRDEKWLIDASYFDAPENIENQLRGFYGHQRVRWLVTADDIVGEWSAGAFLPARIRFDEDGGYRVTYADNGGENVSQTGVWRLENDQLTIEVENTKTVKRVVWVGDGFLQLESSDGRSRSGYHRWPAIID